MLSQKVKSKIAMSNTEHGRFSGLDKTESRAGKNNETGHVDEVYNELIHMRKMNRVLGQRIK
jgi:hypothetical protein